MSLTFIRLVKRLRDSGLSASARAVLRVLADYADDKGRSFPSQVTLATDTGLSERTVRTALSQLEAAGWIVRERRYRPGGCRSSDLVTIQDADRRAAYLAKVRRLPLVALMDGGRAGEPPVRETVNKSVDPVEDKATLPAMVAGNLPAMVAGHKH